MTDRPAGWLQGNHSLILNLHANEASPRSPNPALLSTLPTPPFPYPPLPVLFDLSITSFPSYIPASPPSHPPTFYSVPPPSPFLVSFLPLPLQLLINLNLLLILFSLIAVPPPILLRSPSNFHAFHLFSPPILLSYFSLSAISLAHLHPRPSFSLQLFPFPAHL